MPEMQKPHHRKKASTQPKNKGLRLLMVSAVAWAYRADAQQIAAPAFINEILYEQSGA